MLLGQIWANRPLVLATLLSYMKRWLAVTSVARHKVWPLPLVDGTMKAKRVDKITFIILNKRKHDTRNSRF
jgi:hypothetical protein